MMGVVGESASTGIGPEILTKVGAYYLGAQME